MVLGHWVWYPWSLTIKLVKSGNKEGGWITQSLSWVFFLNRQVFTTKTEIPLVVTFCRCENWKTWLFILVMTCVSLVPFIGGIPKYFRDCLFNIFCTYIYSYKILFYPSWNFSYFRAWECPNSVKDSKQWFQLRGRENNPAGLNAGVNSHRGWRQNCDPGRKNTPLPQSTTKVRSSQVLSAGLWLTLLR